MRVILPSDAPVSIRSWRRGDIPELLALAALERRDGDAAKESYFRWLYLDNPAGKAVISCACAGEKIVGMVANVPLPLARAGMRISASQSVNVLTHPDFRGRGIFVQCARHACDEAIAQGSDLIVGFPNPAALPGWLRIGHRPIGLPIAMAFPVRPSALAFRAVGRGNEFRTFDALYRRIFRPKGIPDRTVPIRSFDGIDTSGMSPASAIGIDPSPQWLAWRFYQHPTREYRARVIGNPRRPSALIVYCHRTSDSGRTAGLQMTYVMDLLFAHDADPAIGFDIISGVHAEALAHNSAMIVALCSPDSKPMKTYRAAGFFPMPARLGWKMPFIIRDSGRIQNTASVSDFAISFGMTDSF